MSRLAQYVAKLASVHASDLLLAPAHPPQYRSAQGLLPLPGEAAVPGADLQAWLEAWLGPERWSRLQGSRALSCVAPLDPKTRLRVRCTWAELGATVQLRVLAGPRTLSELSLPPQLMQLAELQCGLVVVSGVHGSGKTSLLGALVRRIAEQRLCHVVTLEAPIELVHPSGRASISQREVPGHCASFAGGIRSALASDADVIVIHSADESEILPLACRAAGGALVLLELPGSGAAALLERLARSAQGAGESSLPDTLAAVVSLELLPRKGGGWIPAAEILTRSPALAAQLRDLTPGLARRIASAEPGPGSQSLELARQTLLEQGLIDPIPAASRSC